MHAHRQRSTRCRLVLGNCQEARDYQFDVYLVKLEALHAKRALNHRQAAEQTILRSFTKAFPNFPGMYLKIRSSASPRLRRTTTRPSCRPLVKRPLRCLAAAWLARGRTTNCACRFDVGCDLQTIQARSCTEHPRTYCKLEPVAFFAQHWYLGDALPHREGLQNTACAIAFLHLLRADLPRDPAKKRFCQSPLHMLCMGFDPNIYQNTTRFEDLAGDPRCSFLGYRAAVAEHTDTHTQTHTNTHTHGDIGYLLSRHQPLEDTRSLSTGSLSRRALGNLTVDIPASTNDIWKPAQQTKT